MITDFIEGPQLQQQHQHDPKMLANIVSVLKIVHGGSEALPTSVTYWAPFATVRRYLVDLETGFPDLGISAPPDWAQNIAFYRDVTHRLERAIEPRIPVFSHNDVGFVNMMFKTPAMDQIWLIDWDGGGYANPMWDIGELAMWAAADEDMDRFLLTQYWGAVPESRMKDFLYQHRAFKIMGALRLMTECAQAAIDPAYYLSPEEVSHSMDANFAGQHKELGGLVDLLRPRFDRLWSLHGANYQ
jgi:thiamine kinase-like enzyme